jgi:hypothetical protein
MKTALRTLAVVACAAAFTTAAVAGQMHYNAAGHSNINRSLTPKKSFTTKAKVAYSYTRGDGIDRVKNVSDFQHPSTGIYCLLPSVPLDQTQDFPQVSVEWDNSSGFGLLAYWQDTVEFSDCPSGYMEVKTYDMNSGDAPVISDNVAFDVSVN